MLELMARAHEITEFRIMIEQTSRHELTTCSSSCPTFQTFEFNKITRLMSKSWNHRVLQKWMSELQLMKSGIRGARSGSPWAHEFWVRENNSWNKLISCSKPKIIEFNDLMSSHTCPPTFNPSRICCCGKKASEVSWQDRPPFGGYAQPHAPSTIKEYIPQVTTIIP